MYLPVDHAEYDVPTLHRFIKENPLGIIVTSLPSSNFPTVQLSHVPWVLDKPEDGNGLGKLRGHMAKMNPHSKAMIEAVRSNGPLAEDVVVVFNGPVHHYVTPKFYVKTKPATGKVVPTWDYTAVQAYGKATVYCDSRNPETGSYLQEQITALSDYAETKVMGYTGEEGRLSAWQTSDAPERFVELLKKNIIGVEIEITRLEGRFKMSQEMDKEDQVGVVQGFRALNTEVGLKMAETVKQRGVAGEV
ncbi:putative transcriptional protein [Neofusicoccum parvum UCRNP2]|uniref:Putative transcriptional protein n=1 Tax=Botryosphaeria parva (strain UCR-NP2) TaxID=1287680 RepID=R1GHZ5_BOTPV|nr:putative transcriptional protein [Neofusicoccum parvum UCRNP2]